MRLSKERNGGLCILRNMGLGFWILIFFAGWMLNLLGACSQEDPVSLRPNELGDTPMLVTNVKFNPQLRSGASILPKQLDSIEVFFNMPFDASTLSSADVVSFSPVGSSMMLSYTVHAKSDDSAIVFRIHPPQTTLSFGDSYQLSLTKMLLPRNKIKTYFGGYEWTFSVPAVKDTSLKVFYRVATDAFTQKTAGNFYRLLENRRELDTTRLIFKLAKDSKLKIDGKEVQLDADGVYSNTFNFEKNPTLALAVIAAGVQTNYTVTLEKRPPMRITSPKFREGDTLNFRYLERQNPNNPPPVSPPLVWEALPDSTNELILLAWNESSAVSFKEWFIINIPKSISKIEEGEVLQNVKILAPYSGIAVPSRGSFFAIHFVLFAIQLKNPSTPLMVPAQPADLFNNLIEYKRKAEENNKSYAHVVVSQDFNVLGVATIRAKSALR